MSDKIVCLDGYVLNPGDISWEPFENLGDFTIHDRTPAGQIIERSQGAAALLTNKTPLTADTFAQLPDLKYVGVLATGYNVVDVEAAKSRGIPVCNVPTYGTDTVAQHAMALIFELLRGVAKHDRAVHEGKWTNCDDWCFALQSIVELTGRTLGIVGFGRIGRRLAKIGQAMGMNIIAHSRSWPSEQQLDGLIAEQVDLDAIFTRSDIISLHCPLTADNEKMVNAARLKQMKKTAVIINTARGQLIDNQALADALADGTIAAAGLDVLDQEPPPADNPLLSAPNCIITPHLSWYAMEARARLLQTAADNFKAFQNGKPVNVVNG